MFRFIPYLPASQVDPVYPLSHLHIYLFTRSVQVPCMHRSGVQSSLLVSQFSPSHPSIHLHWYPFTLSTQEPRGCRHGRDAQSSISVCMNLIFTFLTWWFRTAGYDIFGNNITTEAPCDVKGMTRGYGGSGLFEIGFDFPSVFPQRK